MLDRPSLPLCLLLVPLACGAGACAPVEPDDARRSWLVDALIQDNQIWLSRDHALLAAKYATMADDPYDFMRGTAGVFFKDIGRAGTARTPTAFLTEPVAAEVLLVGDPHPENLGTFMPGDGPGPDAALAREDWPDDVFIDFNDLDGSAFGPYLLDLRRAATGLGVLSAGLEGCDAACTDAAVSALAWGYADEIARLDAGGPAAAPISEDPLADGDIVARLIEEAEEEGPIRKKLFRYAAPDEATGALTLSRDPALDDAMEGMLALTMTEAQQLDRLAAGIAARGPEGFRVLDAVRRYGSGVASLPAVRYVVLWDTGAEGPEDDALAVVREVVDPAPAPGLRPTLPGLFNDNAARIEQAPRLLWTRPDADARTLGLHDGDQVFKMVSWTSWNQGFDHGDILDDWADGDVGPEDLDLLAAFIGRTLAGAHARAPTASGGAALDALARELEGRQDAFVAERVEVARADLERCMADYALFLDALDRHGPLLGAERLR
ncbi:MAG: DUF2252 family protein [Alphaproteobacteria bacterium]|nr:DUF2252 family protein [Alphaproteobacteria bacterium]